MRPEFSFILHTLNSPTPQDKNHREAKPGYKGERCRPGDPLIPPTRSEPVRLSDFRISRLLYPLGDETLDELTELLALV